MAKRKKKRQIPTPEKAIRNKCKECSNGNKDEVVECPITDCPLWPYRNGFENKEMPMSEDSKKLWETDIEIED